MENNSGFERFKGEKELNIREASHVKEDILGRLKAYSQSNYVPMHMPGAKRNTELFYMDNPYGLDITEIDGFDNMHHADGIILEAFKRAAKLFDADETLFLVNGSSAGILSAISGAVNKGDTVLVARNSHTSVYNALYLNELNPIYICPQISSEGICGAIEPKQVEQAFLTQYNLVQQGTLPEYDLGKQTILDENKQHGEQDRNDKNRIKAVIITSPTYEGIVSDISKIAEITHRYGAVLIVDEAHGAHFNFHEEFPQSAVKCGADAIIQSIHKTLPSFTQTALLHLNGSRIDRERVKMYWSMYQTTSPSYLLMAGIDRCMTFLENEKRAGGNYFNKYIENLKALRDKICSLKNISLIETDDISKIVLAVNDGRQLYDDLRERFHIQLEMASEKYVIAMTSVGDKEEYYDRFAEALELLDKEYGESKATQSSFIESDTGVALDIQIKCSIYEAVNADKELVDLKAAVGRVAASKVCFYPPGVPMINPGEVISTELADKLFSGLNAGLEVIGLHINSTNNEKEVKILCLK